MTISGFSNNLLNTRKYYSPVFKGIHTNDEQAGKPQNINHNDFIQPAKVLSHKDAGGTVVFGKYPAYYTKLYEHIFIPYQPERISKFGGKKRLIKASEAHFEDTYVMLPHYHIDKLWSTGKGSGAAAIKNIVRKSLNDDSTGGRVTVDASCIDGKTSPAGFYYKLGFRFVQEDLNTICENWIKSGGKRENAPFATGMMYLPKENINECLNY